MEEGGREETNKSWTTRGKGWKLSHASLKFNMTQNHLSFYLFWLGYILGKRGRPTLQMFVQQTTQGRHWPGSSGQTPCVLRGGAVWSGPTLNIKHLLRSLLWQGACYHSTEILSFSVLDIFPVKSHKNRIFKYGLSPWQSLNKTDSRSHLGHVFMTLETAVKRSKFILHSKKLRR